MKINTPPILLTSCVIVSDHSVSLADADSRIKFTLESISKWLSISPELRLVVCDGSNYDFSDLVRAKFPNAHIECLHFQNTIERVKKQGKGFGEGEIVNYAIQHSIYLNDAECFAKCTAKLWVENFFDCLKGWDGEMRCKGYFANVFSLRKTLFSYVDTRFYLANKSFYLEHFASAHTHVGGEKGLSLEDCFRDVIITERMGKILFNIAPVICGVGGGTGTYYKNNLRRKLKEALRILLVRRNKSFSHLFA